MADASQWESMGRVLSSYILLVFDALVGMVPMGISHLGKRDSEDDVPWAGIGTSLVEDLCCM